MYVIYLFYICIYNIIKCNIVLTPTTSCSPPQLTPFQKQNKTKQFYKTNHTNFKQVWILSLFDDKKFVIHIIIYIIKIFFYYFSLLYFPHSFLQISLYFSSLVLCAERCWPSIVTSLQRWVRTGGRTLATNVGGVRLQTKGSGTVTCALFFRSPLSFFK